LGVSDENYSKT